MISEKINFTKSVIEKLPAPKTGLSYYKDSKEKGLSLYITTNGIMTNKTEAKARIKINKLLEDAGWCFEDTSKTKANIALEAKVSFKNAGDDFENAQTHDKDTEA